MIVDASGLSLRTLGTVVNALGIGVPLLIFAAQLRTSREPYFRYWSASYLFLLVAILGDVVVQPLGYPYGWTMGLMASYALSSACMLVTAALLVERAPRWGRLAAIGAGSLGLTCALFAAGHPFEIAATPVVLVNLIAHVLLGLAILKTWRSGGNRSGGLLGGWMIFTGLWALAFPVLEPLHLTWVGYAIAGVNHTVVGTGMAVFLLDMASRKLEAQHQELQALSRLKTDFIANVSHELRTPLAVIKAGTYLLDDRATKADDPLQQEIVADLGAQTDHLVSLVETLLDFSKFEMGKLRFDYRAGDLAQLVHEAVSAHGPLLARKGITLDVNAPAALPAVFDPVKLRQVLNNLLSNAGKFTPGEGRVWVDLAVDGDHARLTVRDTGVGIPAELLQQVFTRFFQAEGGRAGKTAGMGLGLSLCKAIVEEGHGGRIWAERPAAGGSAFTIVLPLRPA